MSVVYLKFSGVFFKGNIGGGGERLGSSGSQGVAVSPAPRASAGIRVTQLEAHVGPELKAPSRRDNKTDWSVDSS